MNSNQADVLQKIRDLADSQERTLAFADQIADEVLSGEQDKLVRYALKEFLVSNLLKTFEYSESVIERVFLTALSIASIFYDIVFLYFVPPVESIEDFITEFRQEHKFISDLHIQFQQANSKSSDKDFIDWIAHQTDFSEEQQERMRNLYVLYHTGPLARAYHVSLQSTIKDVPTVGKHIRPDIAIWLPFNPDFKLIVECDGYEFHSNKAAFSNDRARDRILASRGFQVLRFSGSEIHKDPVGKAKELCEYLANRRAPHVHSIHNHSAG